MQKSKEEAMNLEEIREEYMERFGKGEKGRERDDVTKISK